MYDIPLVFNGNVCLNSSFEFTIGVTLHNIGNTGYIQKIKKRVKNQVVREISMTRT